MKYIAMFTSFINGLGRIFWGLLYDIFGFKLLYKIINVFIFFISALIYFMPENIYALFILIPLTGLMHSGVFALIPSLHCDVFGIK
jgi:Na+/melibiose symporter-like transporter